MPEIDDQQVRSLVDDGHKPHLQESLLHFLIRKKVLYPTEAANVIQSVFCYDVSRQNVEYGMSKYGINKPAFHDIIRNDTNETEQGQPPRSLLERSDESPAHPLDTDSYRITPEGCGGDDGFCGELLITAHSIPQSKDDSVSTTTEQPDSSLRSFAHMDGSPWRFDKSNRESSLIAPPFESAMNDLPSKYHACGCMDCPERTFLDGDGGSIDCPNPLPVTVAGARRIYSKTEGSRVAQDIAGNDVSLAEQRYATLTKADSGALSQNGNVPDLSKYKRGKNSYEDITTVLVSLRLTNKDAHDRLVTPYRLIQDCKDGWAEARSHLPTDSVSGLPIDAHNIAYYWTLAGTDAWASPHVHCYLWFGDPDDTVHQELFKPTVQQFTEAATFPADCHLTDDGDVVDGCVTVEHEPPLCDADRLSTRLDDGIFTDSTTGPKRITDGCDEQTQGCVYLGCQLPWFALKGGELPASVEFASFLDAISDGRQNARGSDFFYELADILPKLSEHEEVITG